MGTCGIIDCNRNDGSNTFLHVQSTSIMYKFPIQERKGYQNYGLDDTDPKIMDKMELLTKFDTPLPGIQSQKETGSRSSIRRVDRGHASSTRLVHSRNTE
jgi:hypothetical protein